MFLFARKFLISHLLLREEIRAMCSISKKQLVITQVPLCKQEMIIQYSAKVFFFWEQVFCHCDSPKTRSHS